MADKLSGLGVEVVLPDGWDGRIYRRTNEGSAGERRALHAANFPLPANRGDYGGGVHEQMGDEDVLVTLVEFHADNANKGLFQSQGLPLPVSASAFSPRAMPRPIPGQAGAQFFFSLGERAFCLFVVIGSYADRDRLARQVNAVVESINVE
ncbi:MAG: hypothetical protein ACRD2W_00290 [Acidimicrobiales bacterium]